jgi:hypothetical protein
MNFSQLSGSPLIFVLVRRLVVFFFVMSLLTIFLYVIGTGQEFMDNTQLLLLRIALFLGLFLSAGSIYGIALGLWRAIRCRKFRYIAGAGAYILSGIFGAALGALAAFIASAAEGNVR